MLPIILLVSFVVAGCSKPGKGAGEGTPVLPSVDTAKLRQAFPPGNAAIDESITKVRFATRYGQWDNAMEALNKIAADPSLTDPQKQVVNATIDQVKKIQEAAPAPQPTQ